MTARRKPTVEPATAGEDARVVALAATVLELGEDLAQARDDIAELKRLFGLKIGKPPEGWISLGQAAKRCGVTVECMRLRCLQNHVTADRFQNRWFVDPGSL
jgi:hypothetical protein